MMQRREDWERRLYKVIAGAASRPIAYGHHDCGLFVARCVRALTGADLAADFLGTYKTRREALSIVGAFGGLEALVSRHLGAPRPGAAARRGDPIGLPHTVWGLALGVCDGRLAAVLSPAGLVMIERRLCSVSWRVG